MLLEIDWAEWSIPAPCFVSSDKFDDFDKLRSEEVAMPASAREKALVLVADDEPIIVRTLLEILQGEGYDAVGTRDGLEAVAQAESVKPDLLLLDVAMPRLNGIEAARRIHKFSPKTRVVLLSGQASSMDLLQDARAQGLNFEIIAKPVRPDALLTIIHDLLN